MAGDARKPIRAFVALDLDSLSVRRVARLADRLRMGSGAPSASWTPPGKMHVTLKFMAALPADRIAPLEQALRPLVEGKSAPAAVPIRLDAFPTPDEAQIIVAELLDASGRVAKLAEKVERIAVKLGLPAEERPFRPHVTLARLKRAYDARRWLRPELAECAGDCRVGGLTLYRSELEADVSTYVPVAQFSFVE
jgi:2'-5' RNA ligase